MNIIIEDVLVNGGNDAAYDAEIKSDGGDFITIKDGETGETVRLSLHQAYLIESFIEKVSEIKDIVE